MPLPVRVLVVDDEPPMLRAVERLMRGHGLEVYLESEPLRAIDVVTDRSIDILVSDYSMPQMTGIALLARAKAERPRVLRVLMSGSTDRQVAIDAINEGGIEYFLEKPWPPGELQRVLLQLAERARSTRAIDEIVPDAAAALRSFKK